MGTCFTPGNFARSLDRCAKDESVLEQDASFTDPAAETEQPRLPRQTHDLENVAEGEVLETADETHPPPNLSPARDSGAGPGPVPRHTGSREESAGERVT